MEYIHAGDELRFGFEQLRTRLNGVVTMSAVALVSLFGSISTATAVGAPSTSAIGKQYLAISAQLQADKQALETTYPKALRPPYDVEQFRSLLTGMADALRRAATAIAALPLHGRARRDAATVVTLQDRTAALYEQQASDPDPTSCSSACRYLKLEAPIDKAHHAAINRLRKDLDLPATSGT